jgi:IMP cyclohydrolase
MTNPNGPYPGRQLFVGLLADGSPCLAYLVTGRSPASRERMADQAGDGVRIGPPGKAEYDPLRHYTAALFDRLSGLAVVSNGIQTEAVYEAYRLLYNVDSPPDETYLQMLMEGARAEPDSLNTPRIAGVVTRQGESGRRVYLVAVKRADMPAVALPITVEPGVLFGVSTYQGDLANPLPFDVGAGPARLQFDGEDAHDLANYLYDISEASNEGQDIRVCAIGAMYSDEDAAWDVAIKNRRNE